MSDWHRYYECGCAPADEEFCKIGDFLIWTGRDAASELALIEGDLPKPFIRRLEKLDTESSLLMTYHLKHQEEEGKYKDMDWDAPENQPSDDGYDEDPAIVGYP